MKNKFNIITLLSDGHNFAFHGFWRTTDIFEDGINVMSEKPISGLYKVGDMIEVSLFPSEFPAIHVRCSFDCINEKEFELRIIDFPSLKDKKFYNNLLLNISNYGKELGSDIISSSEKLQQHIQM